MLNIRNRPHRKLGLYATASLLSTLAAGPAFAACVVDPVTEPINNIQQDYARVDCNGPNTAQTIVASAEGVWVDINPGATLDNSTITMNGDDSLVNFYTGASSNNLAVNITGNLSQAYFASGTSATNFSLSLIGNNNELRVENGATITATPGNIFVASSPGTFSQVNIAGMLSATGNNGGAFLLTSGAGKQVYGISGTLTAAPNGLLISSGDDDDLISFASTAALAGGTGNNFLIDGGNGNDELGLVGSGNLTFNTINIERLTINPGNGGLRVLNGTGDYSSVVIQIGGTVSVLNNAALGQANSSIAIANAARLRLDFTAATNFLHALAGGGTVEQTGQTVTYAGTAANFTGNFLISGGTAVIATSNAFGNAAITNNSALEFGGITLGNTISGTGTVTKTGGGLGILSGTNTYTGGTFVQGGVLTITNGAAVSSGTVNVAAGAAFDLNFATDQIFANDITGAGGVTKNGLGVVTLTGTNTYGGGTIIYDGGIRVDDLARLGTGPVSASTGAFLQLDYNGAAPLVLNTSFLSGGGGFIKDGTGEVELGNTGNWSGGSLIRAGTLRLVDGGGLGTGQVRVNAGATLALGNAFSSPSVGNNITGNGRILLDAVGGAELRGDNSGFTGAIDILGNAYLAAELGEALGSGSVNLIGAGSLLQFSDTSNTTIAATLTGAGTFQKTGANVVDLTGTNSLTGLVDVIAGVLRVSSGANIGTANVQVRSGADFDINTTGLTTFGNTVYGQGRLTKSGTGTVLLTGSNSQLGGTTIFEGAIRVTNLSALGSGPVSVFNGALLDLSIAGSATLGLTASGNGRLRKSDVGDLTLLSNSLGGGIDIVGGRVIVNTSAALGNGPVTTAADTQLVFDNSTTEVNGTLISGAGALTKNGTGTLVLQNANTYSGGTVINAGRLGLNHGGALGSGTVLVQLGAILGIGDIAFANTVTGAGQIVKTAGGNATLTGVNSHSGGIDIQAGSVSVTGNAPLGSGGVSIASGAQLIYANSANASFTNALSGAGTFNKQGAGMVTFSNPFAVGALAVNTGRVRINTNATTNATVASGATLDGTGRIIGNLTNNGIVAPGNSIGTLTVQGNYVHGSGSVLEIEFDGAGGIDRLDVTGTATLNGGTLRFISIGGAEGSGGTFLTAAGGVSGTFTTVETVGAQLPLAVIYLSNSAIMAPSVLTARPSTVNAQSFAAADTALGFIDAVAEAPRTGEGSRLWLQAFGADGNRSAGGTTLAYGHNSHGLSGGLVLPLGGGWSAGASVGWAKGDIALGSGGGGGEQDSLIGGVQIGYAAGGVTLAVGAVAGKVDQETLRNVSFNSFSASVAGATESSILGGYVSAEFGLGKAGGWDFGLGGRASLIRQSQDAYTESGASPLRLSYGDIETSTLEARAGISAGRSFGGGLRFRADAGARWLSALGDRAIPVTFAASNAGIVLQGDTRDGVQGYGAARLDWAVSDRVTIGAGYSGQIGQTDRHEGRIGLSIGF